VTPVLAELQLTETATDGEVTIRVAISENEKAERVWVEVYPPTYSAEQKPCTFSVCEAFSVLVK